MHCSASATPPVKEVVKHDHTGRLVDFFSHSRLAEEVCYLLENEHEARSLAKNARAFVIDNYDLDEICLPQQVKWVEALQ